MDNVSYEMAPSGPGDILNYVKCMSMSMSKITVPRRSRMATMNPVTVAAVRIVQSMIDFPDTITFSNDKIELFLLSSVIFRFYDSILSTPLGILHLLSQSLSQSLRDYERSMRSVNVDSPRLEPIE